MPDTIITKTQLSYIEKVLNKLFASLNINIDFSNHFLDRLNDPRNGEPITVKELVDVYNSLYDKHGVTLSHTPEEIEEIIKSISKNLNIPIVVRYNRKTNKIDVVAKTIIRKKNFMSSSPVLTVESTRMSFTEFLEN